MQKTERLVAITLLLQARGKMTAKRLAELLGVSTRTIYRDMDALSLAHVPVSMDYGPNGGYYLPDDYRFESAIFTREEAVSLVLSGAMAGNYGLFADDDDLQLALLKLEAALPEEYRADVNAARERILFDTTAWYGQSSHSNNSSHPTNTVYVETIRSALLSAHQLDILYPDAEASGTHWLRVDPYGLVCKGVSRRHMRIGIWYLVAFCHTCQDFRTFRISFIEDVKVSEETVDIMTDFDLQAYWEEARKHLEEQMQSFTLTLRVIPSALQAMQGDVAVLHEEPDGNVVARVNVESFEAAVSYALALGADATVLSPVDVRDAVAATAHVIAEMYEQ